VKIHATYGVVAGVVQDCAGTSRNNVIYSLLMHAGTVDAQDHSAASTYKCPCCGKSFSSLTSWKKHGRVHDKLYVCYMCARSFADPYQLKNHIRKHSASETSSCDVFGGKFPDSAALKIHTCSRPADYEHVLYISFLAT